MLKINVSKLGTVKTLTVSLLMVLSVALIFIYLYAEAKKDLIEKNEHITKTASVAHSVASSVPGVSCTILSVETVQERLPDSKLQRSSTNGIVTIDTNEWRHEDSCRYIDTADSARYMELFITTYQNELTAEEAFKKRLPVVADLQAVTIERQELDQALYDAGVHYILKGKQIIETSAGVGSSAKQTEASRVILLQALDALQPVSM